MAKMQGYNPGLSNEMLTLWLKARDGLSCEEARDLIERLAVTEQEVEFLDDKMAEMYSQEEYEEAQENEAACGEGEKAGKIAGYKRACDEYAVCLARVLNPAWGPPPTKAKIIKELEIIIRQMREDDGRN